MIERILFASTYCLLDRASGAAISTLELLRELAKQGFHCEVVSASIFDPEREVSLDEIITGQESADGSLIDINDGLIRHTILKTKSSRRQNLKLHEEEKLISAIEKRVEEFQPDLLLTYGGLSAERKIHRLARSRRIPIIFYLHNSLYRKSETFSEVDLILVCSKFLSEFYANRLGIKSTVLYPLFNGDQFIVDQWNPRYITFINPVPHKGLTLFARIVADCLRELPQAEFLVVEGRWTREEVRQAGLKLERIPNIKVIPNQKDVKKVFAETRILLYPSFWVEAFGRTLVEAQFNGIPVLASRRGGIPEALNGGGFIFDIPERCKKDYMALPTSKEVRPWIEKLRLLLENKEAYEEAQRKAIRASEDFRPEKTLEKAIELLNEVKRGRAPFL